MPDRFDAVKRAPEVNSRIAQLERAVGALPSRHTKTNTAAMAEVLQDELRALQALWAPPAAAAAAAQHGMLPPSPSAALHSLSAGTSSGRTAARPPPDRQQLRSAPAPALPPLVPPPAVAARAAAAADAAPAGSPRPLRVADYQTASTAVLQRQVQLVHHALRACQAACAQAGADVANAQQRISQLEQQICALQQEEAELAEQPLRANRLAHVREWLAERCSTLAAETAALDGKQQVLLKAESQLHATEIEGDLLAEAGASLNTAAAGEAAAQRRRAAGARAREDAAARQALRQAQAQQQQAQQQQAQQAAAAQQAEAERRARAAQQAGAAAQQRLAASQVVIRAREAAAQQAAAAVAERRRQALLLVKQRIDDVRAQIGRKAARCRQLQAQRAEQEAAEFSALAQQGLNPYEVFARRKAEAAAAKAAAQAAAAAQARAAAAAVQLAAEEREHRRLLKQQEAERQVEQRYQQELGRKVQLAKTDAYMRSHTLAGTAILDPTSRLHQHPSDCVAVKPASFGLGRASPQALRLVAARHGGSGDQELQDSCLLPRKYRDMCAGDAAAGSGQSSDAGGTAGDDAGEELDNADGGGGALEPGQHAATNSSSQLGGGGKGLAVAKLSTFEADRMRQAKAAHKARVTQPKAAFGRTFSGDAFIAQPPEVVFRDFLPGSTYSATLRLINRGYTRNSIRLLDVPAEVMHVIELEMPPSGSLAPGASATLRITFTPQAEEDLASSIRLLAESGPLGVPLSCLARRALPSVAPAPLVCLDGRAGGVMLAATARSCLRISNAGALAVDYTVQVTGPLAETTEHSDDQQQEDQQPPSADASTADGAAGGAAPAGSPKPRAAARSLAVAGFRVVRTRGRVPGHGEASIAVEFTPRVPGQVSVPLLVSFAAPEREGLAVPPVELTLKATGRELPVTTLTPVVDFKRVLFGGSYVAPLVLANAGSAAMKAAIVAPPELAEWVAFQPTFGFVQAGETLTVSVSLKPAAAMLDKLARHLLPGGQDVLVVPLHVSVPGQSLPLRVKLRLQPSTGELVLAPSILDFDAVPLSEAAVTALAISNPGRLPQAFSFGARLPQGVSISPGGGYGCVLPGQTLTLQVACRPAIPGPQSFRLACRTLAGRTFMLTGRCKGLAPVVTLSHNAVKFPATAVGDASSASVVLRNSSASEAHAFELAVPVGSHLTVTPAAGVLQPGGSVRLQLDYAPPASLMAAAADGSGDAAAGSTAGAAAGLALQPQREQQQDAAVLPTEPPAAGPPAASSSSWRCYREWVLPCHVRPAQQQDSDTDASADDASSSSSPDIVLHLAVTTCAVAPQLHILSPQLPVPPGKAYAVLDFGPLPVGLRATRALTLANSGPDPAPLSAAPLDPAGVFSVVAALRPLPPGGDGRLLLAFCPQACCEYWEVLTLRSPKSRLRVALKGAGVAPSLSVSPPAAAAAGGGLCFGDVALGDPGPRELKLAVTNTCPFSVSWTTRFIGPGPPAAAAGAAAALPAALPAAAAPAAAPAAAAAAVLAAPAAPAPAATAASPGPPSGWFFCRPSGGVLAAGQSQELTVVFAPGAQQGLLPPGLVGDRLQLLVPHQQQELVVPVSGSAWPDGVYVAGPSYACSSLTGGGSEAAAAAAAADPFAAVLAAAAAAAAAPGTAPAGSTGSSKAKAAGGAGAAAPAAAAGKSGAAAAAAAAAAAGVSCGHVTLPGPVAPGQATSITLEFGAVKPSGGGACPSGELLVEELPAAAREAGWSLDALKVAAPPGERRPLVVRYAAPAKLAAGGPGTLLAAGVPLRQTLRLQCVMRGGWAAGGAAAVADGGRRLTIECSCIVAATAPLLS